MKEKTSSLATEYERNQSFNRITHWLHSRRYKNILDVFSRFQSHLRPIRVVEIGCAHAKLFSILDERFRIDYVGIEPNSDFVEMARERYGHKENFSIIHDSAMTVPNEVLQADVIVALETLEHIPEGDVVRLVEKIALARPVQFVCSVPVEIGPAIWVKNIGSLLMGYMRHKEYSWYETFWAGVYQLDKLSQHGTGHKGFDWRWLAQTIRHNMRIRELKKSPLPLLPAGISTSVFIVAEPRQQE